MVRTPRLLVAAGLSLTIAATGLALNPSAADATPKAAGAYVGLAPSRVLDTRHATAIPADGTITVQVAGRGGVPATGVSAVTLNLTVTQPTSDGFLTVYPSGTQRPNASNLNYAAGQTDPNLATVKVGADGTIKITNTSGGSAHVYADVVGYYRAGAASAAGTFTSLNPTRVLDSRVGTGADGPVPAGGTIGVQMAGRAGIPATGVAAVVLNLTVTESKSNGFLTAYPSGTKRPDASNLNYAAGQTVANMATVKVGADGKIKIANTSNGSAHVVADVAGYYLAGTPTVEGAFVSLDPTRIVDSRRDHWALQPKPGNTTVVQIAGRGGVPKSGASAVVMNTTVTETHAPGFLTVYPDANAAPNLKNVTFGPGETVASMVNTGLSANGQIDVTNSSNGSAAIVADLAGYFVGPTSAPSPSATPSTPAVPTTPVVTPTKPAVTPTTPSTTPSVPSATPTAPSTSPTAPSATPTVPSVTPTAPSTSPTAPSATPTVPSTTPTAPSTTPTVPSTTPSAPVTTPATPSDALPAGAGVPWDDSVVWSTSHNPATQNNNSSAVASIDHEDVQKTMYNGRKAFEYSVDVIPNHPGGSYTITLYVNGVKGGTFTGDGSVNRSSYHSMFLAKGQDAVNSVYCVIS